MKLSRREAKKLYKYFYDVGNRFAASKSWSMDTAILFIIYNAKIKNKTKFKFQEIRNFRIVYDSDANFRYLISTLQEMDKHQGGIST